jgi:diketogulonate reductase-like aldo/keto reductase
MRVPSATLESGDEMPMIGAGTWDIGGETVKTSVRAALEAGYTHIDTAEGYRNEAEIGEVLAERDRGELFLTSKVLPSNLNYENVLEACERSLEKLGTDYLDLYLIHWPNPAISLRETLDAMGTLYEERKVRNVGVSNFDVYQLRVAQRISDVPIAVDQVELHPWFPQEELREYATDNDVVLTAAAPLTRTRIFGDETIQAVAEEYDRSPAQITLRWACQKGVVTVPKSSSPEHIRQNIQLFDWELDDDAIARIDDIDHHERVYMLDDLDDDIYGISP